MTRILATSALALIVVACSGAAGKTSSNGSGGRFEAAGGAGDANGGSTGSGGSSGISTGGAASGGTLGASTGGASASIGGSAGQMAAGPTKIASASAMVGLTVAGGAAYWTSGKYAPSGVIQSVPVTGVAQPTTVLVNSDLQGDLASDGSRLYFTTTHWTLQSVGFDGTGQKTLASGYGFLIDHSSPSSELFVFDGKVYLQTDLFTVVSVPVDGLPDGGTPTPLVQGLVAGDGIADLLWVDGSGIYLYGGLGGASESLGYVPIGGGTITKFYDVPNEVRVGTGGNFAVVGGTAYFLVDGLYGAVLMKITPPSAVATTVATYTNQTGTSWLVGDAKGLYAFEDLIDGGSSGIYSVDAATGRETSVFANLDRPDHLLSALDSKSVYFVLENGGYDLYAMSRQ